MRLFTGIALPPEATATFAELMNQLRSHADLAPRDLNWTRPDKLHITTKFIGEWPEARLTELVQALGTVVVHHMTDAHMANTMETHVRRLGWMPNPRFPTALYAGVELTDHLNTLAASTEDALAPLGIVKEQRLYRPHITLARVRDRRRPNLDAIRAAIEPHCLDDFARFAARGFCLYLSADGKYTKLNEFPFQPA